ncbi:MAG TPA: DinB family protein [Holophagaceae bacterium]|nr:DinB family protein [Holophagaceae bacterium]
MPFDLAEARALLARTPEVLAVWLDGLPAPWLEADEGPDTFSPRDVLAHLIQGERSDWFPRVRMILKQGESQAFPPFDRRAFQEEARAWTVEALLAEFRRLRQESLAGLDALALAPSDLARRGVHPAFGPVTLEQLLATWTVHDLGHLAQIARVMAKRYKTEVGPWVDYLPILTR